MEFCSALSVALTTLLVGVSCFVAATTCPKLELDLHGIEPSQVSAALYAALSQLDRAQTLCVELRVICGHGRPWVSVLGDARSNKELRTPPVVIKALNRLLERKYTTEKSKAEDIQLGIDELRASFSPKVKYIQREDRSAETTHRMMYRARQAILDIAEAEGSTVDFALESKSSVAALLPSSLNSWNDGVLRVFLKCRAGAEGIDATTPAGDTSGSWATVEALLRKFWQVQVALDFLWERQQDGSLQQEQLALLTEKKAKASERFQTELLARQGAIETEERQLEAKRQEAHLFAQAAHETFQQDFSRELLDVLRMQQAALTAATLTPSPAQIQAKERLKTWSELKLDSPDPRIRQANEAFNKFAQTVSEKWAAVGEQFEGLHSKALSGELWHQWSAPVVNKMLRTKFGAAPGADEKVFQARTGLEQRFVKKIPIPQVLPRSDLLAYANRQLLWRKEAHSGVLLDNGEVAQAQSNATHLLGVFSTFFMKSRPCVEGMKDKLVGLFSHWLLASVERAREIQGFWRSEVLRIEQIRVAVLREAARLVSLQTSPAWPSLSKKATSEDIYEFIDACSELATMQAQAEVERTLQVAKDLWERAMSQERVYEVAEILLDDLLLLLKPAAIDTDQLYSVAAESVALPLAAQSGDAAFKFFMLRPSLRDYTESSDKSLFALVSPLKALALFSIALEETVTQLFDRERFESKVEEYVSGLNRSVAAYAQTTAADIRFAEARSKTRVRATEVLETLVPSANVKATGARRRHEVTRAQHKQRFLGLMDELARVSTVAEVSTHALQWLCRPEHVPLTPAHSELRALCRLAPALGDPVRLLTTSCLLQLDLQLSLQHWHSEGVEIFDKRVLVDWALEHVHQEVLRIPQKRLLFSTLPGVYMRWIVWGESRCVEVMEGTEPYSTVVLPLEQLGLMMVPHSHQLANSAAVPT